jgi:hypothetical protein
VRRGNWERRGAVADLVVGGDAEVKTGAFADPAFHGDRSAHAFAEAFGDDESQARAAAAAFGGGIHLAEGAEELVDFVGGDADAGVAHAELQPHVSVGAAGEGFFGGGGDADGDAAFFGELDGVADEVAEDLADAAVVAVDEGGQAGGDLGVDGEAGFSGAGAEEGADLVQAVAQGEGGVLDLDLAGFDLGEIEDVADEGFERLAAAGNHIHEGALLGGERGVAEQFGEADDAVDGRADFVADDGQKFALGAVGGFGGFLGGEEGEFGFFAGGDVVADGLVFDDAAFGIFDGAVRPGVDDRRLVAVGAGLFEDGGLGERGDVGLDEAGGEREAGLADEFEAFASEETGIGAVDEGEFALGRVAADEVGLVFDDGAVAGFEFLQGLGHAFDFAGEADDLVVDFVVVGVVESGLGGFLGDVAEALDEGAVPDVAAQDEQHAADHREAEDKILGRQRPVVGDLGDDDGRERGQQCEHQGEDQHGFSALHGTHGVITAEADRGSLC